MPRYALVRRRNNRLRKRLATVEGSSILNAILQGASPDRWASTGSCPTCGGLFLLAAGGGGYVYIVDIFCHEGRNGRFAPRGTPPPIRKPLLFKPKPSTQPKAWNHQGADKRRSISAEPNSSTMAMVTAPRQSHVAPLHAANRRRHCRRFDRRQCRSSDRSGDRSRWNGRLLADPPWH